MESQSPSLTKHLLKSTSKSLYDAATKHDFLTAAGAGTLDHPRLALWLSQDKIYATQGYPRFIGSLIANMAYNKPHLKGMSVEESYHHVLKILIFCLENIGREIDFFKTTAEKWNLDLGGWKDRDATKKYLAEMDRAVNDHGPGIEFGLVFLWAMERVYLDAWTYVKNQLQTSDPQPDKNITVAATSSFAANWSNDEFVAFVEKLANLVDSLDIAPGSPAWKTCEEIWSRVVELEVYFWPESGEEITQRVINLTDPVFRGLYHGKRKHDDDFTKVLERSNAAGVKSTIITGGSLRESKKALDMAKEHGLYATVGCHPTRSAEFDKYKGGPEAYLEALDKLVGANLMGGGRAVAIGECGLDYDRLHFADKDVQKKHFRSQLALAKKYHLPLFLHSRAAHKDFVTILREEGFGQDGGKALGAKGGVVHSFTGTIDEVEELMSMGFHIGVNGCSLKTEDNLKTSKSILLDKIMLETDAPWCTMTSTHASKAHLDTLPPSLSSLYFPPSTKPERFTPGKLVKGRNEPCAIGGVAWVMHKLNPEVPFEELAEKAWKNTVEVFGLEELEANPTTV